MFWDFHTELIVLSLITQSLCTGCLPDRFTEHIQCQSNKINHMFLTPRCASYHTFNSHYRIFTSDEPDFSTWSVTIFLTDRLNQG